MLEARTARVSIPGVLESSGRPIKSPATGQEHRVGQFNRLRHSGSGVVHG